MRALRSESGRNVAGALMAMAMCVVAVALTQSAAPPTPNWNTPPTADFPLAGGSYSNQRYSALSQINRSNVAKLGAVWSMRVEEPRLGGTLDGTPVVVDGVMYVSTGARNVLALDVKTGDVKWRYRPESPEGKTGANKGVVVADGKVVFGRRDNVLIALDQHTGRVVWQTPTTTQRAAYSSAAPVYYDGLVFIGVAGGDLAVRGEVAAYDVKTGKQVWRFSTIPRAGERFSETWEADAHRWGGGVWNHVALDPDLGTIYAGVGNAGPDTDGRLRGGDNLFTASILALDLRTGAYKWHFQEVHHDVWDYDAASPPVLADITYRGTPRKVLMHPGKTGFFYVLDRTTGKPLIGVEEKAVRQEARIKTARTQPFPVGDRFVPLCPEPLGAYEQGCLFTPFWDKPVLIFPGSSGGNAWAPMTFSPQTNLAYIPASVMSTVYTSKYDEFDESSGTFRKIGGGDGFVRPPGAQRSGTLTAMDPTTNRIVWQKQTTYPMGTGSGLLSTAGGLIFHGESDGNLVAYDIRNGEELWKFQTGAGANGPVSTFEADGEQYVAVMAGGNNILLSPRGDFLWTFKLGGTLPQAPPGRQPPLIHPTPPQQQSAQYPVTVIAPGKGPYTFPAGYETPWDKIEIRVTEKMSPVLYVLHGSEGLDPAHPDASGGRAMALFGPDGVLMVDTQNRQVADQTLKAIRSFTDGPIRVLVDTHVHSDHTGANAFFARQGALIYAQENLRNELLRPPPRANGQPVPAPDTAAIPVGTYAYNPATPGEPAVTFNMNGETVDFIPMMPSHTAGDTIVRFRKANVIYIEDFYRNFGYPFADQANGGSITGMIDAVDLIEKLAGPDTTLVPGHGTLIRKNDLRPYRAMLVDIMARVKTMRDRGTSLKDVLAANLTVPYDKTTQGDTQASKDRFITEVYDEVKDFPPVVDGKRTMPKHP